MRSLFGDLCATDLSKRFRPVVQDSDDAWHGSLQSSVARELELDFVEAAWFLAVLSHFAEHTVADQMPLNSVSIVDGSKTVDGNLQPGLA